MGFPEISSGVYGDIMELTLPVIEEAEQSVAPWYSVPYHEQLERKTDILHKILGAAWHPVIRPILASPQLFNHRNKMEFSFGYDQDEQPALGFHQRGKFWRVRDLNRSVCLSDKANEIYARIKEWAAQTNLPFYRQVDNRGFFRYLVLREGKRTGEVLANVVVNPSGYEDQLGGVRADLVSLAERAGITSLWLSFRRSVGDVATGEQSELLYGRPTITEQVSGLTFHISPASFFQVNSFGTEVLYEKLRELAGQSVERRSLLDLYCGSGGVALVLSHLFEKAYGVDSHAHSISIAVENAKLNGIQNARFICASANKVGDAIPSVDLLVVDPPRAGLTPKTVRTVLRMKPKRLLYVSCNPESFRDDAKGLKQQLPVQEIFPLDLFPHTPHIELIALFQYRER
jgi:23S rRNA (uracil-5-)-methyltransferase RumA